MKNQVLVIVLNILATILFLVNSITMLISGKLVPGLLMLSAAVLFASSTFIQFKNSKNKNN